MLYVFMDNFRGFSKTMIPLRRATFLVGENSTGKSSFLSLVQLLTNPNFWFNQDFSSGESQHLGGFKDMVSITSEVQNRFTIGSLTTRQDPDEKNGLRQCRFGLMTFRNEEGMPRMTRYIQYIDGKLIKVLFFSKSTRFKKNEVELSALSEEEIIQFFLSTFDEDLSDRRGFREISKSMPPYLPLPVVLAIIQSTDEPKKWEGLAFSTDLPLLGEMRGLTWLAPIRTKPRRTYDGFKTDFTPEGDHTPHVIRKTQASRSRETAKKFKQLLRRFGESSGLFTYVHAHSFGKDPAAPFEVQIGISGGMLNISNVGYGVSQVLPVVVEMLTRPNGHWFAIQQPEVHLHPRAQVSLADLLHFLVQERNHHYVIETHSEYLIDRFRLRIKETGGPNGCNVVFFERGPSGNVAHLLQIDEKGKYPKNQPPNFKKFFIDEEIKLLEI